MSDAAKLEREAEAARARLSDTADQLRARMTPGQLMDEVLNQVRGGDGSQMLANLRDQVRDNPMALALVGGGLAWLMMGQGGSPGGSPGVRDSRVGYARGDFGAGARTAPYPGALATPGPIPQAMPRDDGFGTTAAGRDSTAGGGRERGGVAGMAHDASEAASDALSSARGAVAGMAHDASDALSSARGAVGEGLDAAGERAQRLAHDLRSAGSGALGEVGHSASEAGHYARDTFLDVLHREPLVIGAIGVAIGAAIGAFLPTTEVERRNLGPAGAALKDKAGALADRGMAEAREAASEVYAAARDEADRQGLLPGDTPVADKLGAVVRAAGETAGGAVEHDTRAATSSDAKAGAKSGTADTKPGTKPGAGAATGSRPNDPKTDDPKATDPKATDPKATGSDAGSPSGQPQSLLRP